MKELQDTVQENDVIANRNGPDALMQSADELASNVLQSEFDCLSASIRADFDDHKEEQEIQKGHISQVLDTLDQRIDKMDNKVLDLKDELEKNTKEATDMKMTISRLCFEVEDKHKVLERLVATQNDSDDGNQAKIQRLEDLITKFCGEIEKRVDEFSDDIDNSILQLNKQLVIGDSKTSTLETLIQSVIQDSQNADSNNEVKNQELRNYVIEQLNENRAETMKLWDNLTKAENEMRTVINQVLVNCNPQTPEETQKTAEMTEHDFDNRPKNGI